MIKKILMYLFIITGFIFAFLHGDKINILAYTQYDNTLGTYPAKLDVDNYDTKNLLILNDMSVLNNSGVTYSYENQVLTLNGSFNVGSLQIGQTSLPHSILLNGDYTFSVYFDGVYSGVDTLFFTLTDADGHQLLYCQPPVNLPTKCSRTHYDLDSVITQLRMWIHGGDTFDNLKIRFQLEKGVNSTDYVKPFIFGNMVGYQLNLYNTKSYSITTNVKINNYNEQVIIRSVTVGAYSYYELKGNISTNSQGTTDTRFYLPYNLDSDGIISMDYKLSINITNPDIVLKSDENIQNDSYFLFEPVFNTYYKGEPTNNLYFKNSYVFNSLMYTGMNARGQGLNSLYFNCYGNVSDNYCIYDSLTIAPNTTENVLAFNVTSTGIRNNINFNDVFIYEYTDSYGFDSRSTLFSFQLNIGNTNTSLTSGVSYDINMSQLTLLVINNNSTTSPLPNNPDTNNKYNVCDAWYDIPCQLGNAITYVIYETPIISPIVEFITTFIDGLQYVITYIKWFESLGVVFSLFIFILMIRLLIMLIKGSNDDRGGNK